MSDINARHLEAYGPQVGKHSHLQKVLTLAEVPQGPGQNRGHNEHYSA